VELVSTGYFDGPERLRVLDSVGGKRRSVGSLPPTPTGTPAQIAQQAYQAYVALNPTRTKIAVATRHADRIEIFALASGSRIVAERPDAFDPTFTVATVGGSAVFATDGTLRFGYIDIDATEAYIYALYSGIRRGERPGRANFGQSLLIFDWAGAIVARYALDALALSLAVNRKGDRVYTVVHDPTPAIIEYVLPQVRRPR
jgi:hypothetical protein